MLGLLGKEFARFRNPLCVVFKRCSEKKQDCRLYEELIPDRSLSHFKKQSQPCPSMGENSERELRDQ